MNKKIALKKKSHIQPIYKEWLGRDCWFTWEAACIFSGIEPSKYALLSREHRQHIISVDKGKKILDIIDTWHKPNNKITASPYWYVNHALSAASFKLPNKLLNEIRKKISKFLLIDTNLFIDAYPYIAKQLSIKKQKIHLTKAKKSLSVTEKSTLLKIILGMAIDKYGYDPLATRNDATGEKNNSIASKLIKINLPVSSDTIYKYLSEAKDEHPDARKL